MRRRLTAALCGALLLPLLAGASPSSAAVAAGDDGLLVWVATGGTFAEHADGSGYAPFAPGSPFWTPDGRHVLVRAAAPDGTARVALQDVASGALRLTPFPGDVVGQVAVHPDGTRAAVRGTDADTGLSVSGLDGSGRRDVSLPGGGHVQVNRLAWSPTGDRLLVLSSDRPAETYVLDDGATTLRTLLQERVTSASWSPDGTQFVAVMEDPHDVRVLTRDGALVRRLPTPSSGAVYDVAWSPSGTRIALSSASDNHVWTVHPDGTGMARFDTAPYAKVLLGWQPAQPVASLGLTASATSVTSPGSVRLSLSSRGAQGAAIELLARPKELTGRTVVARLHLDQAGLGSLVLTPSRATCWVLQSRRPGDGVLVQSAERCATVRWALKATVPSTSGRTLTVPVRVGPAVRGTLVQLQARRSDGSWATRGTARTAADGTARVAAALPAGRSVVRVAVPSATGRTGVTSTPVTVTVR